MFAGQKLWRGTSISAVCAILLPVLAFGLVLVVHGVNRLPLRFLNAQNVFDIRMLPVFGHCLASWEIVPVIYVLTGVLAAFAGKYVYRNYQVSGR